MEECTWCRERLALFSVNNRKIIDQGKYCDSLPIARDPLRVEEIEDLCKVVLSERGLDIISFEIADEQLILKLRCQLKGVDQVSKMFIQSGHRVRKFIVRMKYYEVPIIEQLMGAFQIIRHQIRQEFEFTATVLSVENTTSGEFRGHTRQFRNAKERSCPSFQNLGKNCLSIHWEVLQPGCLMKPYPRRFRVGVNRLGSALTMALKATAKGRRAFAGAGLQ